MYDPGELGAFDCSFSVGVYTDGVYTVGVGTYVHVHGVW